MKLVMTGFSLTGSGIPAARPASIHLRSHAMLRPSSLITCIPSSSWRTWSGVLPCTMFQYFDETTGIDEIVKYLLIWSNAAVVPPLRALTMPAAGL